MRFHSHGELLQQDTNAHEDDALTLKEKLHIQYSRCQENRIIKLGEKNLKFKVYFKMVYVTFGVKNKLVPSKLIFWM